MPARSEDWKEKIRIAVRSKYQKVADNPEGLFSYPVGRESVLKLGYDPLWLESVPSDVVSGFVGVGNPFKIQTPNPGDRVLDAGCGCGLDTFIASFLAGPSGTAMGIDISEQMLALPRAAAGKFNNGNIEFREGSVENLPFEDSSFDLVLSNGVLNLVPDKAVAFSEIARVLRPKGAMVAADLLVIETIPQEIVDNTDAWSTWIAGAIPGRDYIAALRNAGFRSAEILGKTGYSTSRYTDANYILAIR